MNSRLTLALLAVLAILGGVVYYTEQNAPPTQDDLTNQPEVFKFAAGDVQAITVEADGRTVELVRKDDAWQIIKPVEDKAEELVVTGLLGRLGTLRASRELEVPLAALTDYGLVTPKTVARLRLSDGKTIEFTVGDRAPDSSGYYLKTADRSSVFVVNLGIGDELKRWVDKPPRAQATPTAASTRTPSN